MRIPGVVGFRRGGLWREFFITFSTYAYMRTFLIKTPNNPPPEPDPPAFPLKGDSGDLAAKGRPAVECLHPPP